MRIRGGIGGLGLSIIAGMAIGLTANVSSAADQVVMRDGTVHRGTVVSQTRRQVVIDTTVHGIRTRLTLDRRQISTVAVGVEEETTPIEGGGDNPTTMEEFLAERNGEEAGDTAATEEEAGGAKILKRDGYDLVIEIPMNGTFGQDIYPLGIADSLEWAKQQGATDIVFRMNSGGGEVWAAMAIVEIMDDYADQFRYHALIEHAISATIWPSFNCDTITMTPGATFGGAVVYTVNGTGSTEVDLKMTSIYAAKLAGSAEAHGHSPHLIRAMMMSEEAVYAERKGGEWVLTNVKPDGEHDIIDGPDTVLTITAEQAAKYGIVTAIDNRSIGAWAEANDLVQYDHDADSASEAAADAVERCKDLRADLMGVTQAFFREVGVLDGRNNMATVGSSLQNIRRNLGRYKSLMRRAESLQMAAIVDSFEEAIDVEFWENEIETRMRELRRWRRLGP